MSEFIQAEHRLAMFLPDFMQPDLDTVYGASFLASEQLSFLKDAPNTSILISVLQDDVTDQ
jgi:hypothetical protein